jgi:hypothetical protein
MTSGQMKKSFLCDLCGEYSGELVFQSLSPIFPLLSILARKEKTHACGRLRPSPAGGVQIKGGRPLANK